MAVRVRIHGDISGRILGWKPGSRRQDKHGEADRGHSIFG